MLEAGEVISVKLSVKYLILDNILIMLDADELFNSTSNLPMPTILPSGRIV